MESEAVHEEVPKEEAAVKTLRALKKRHGDRHLEVGHRGKQKERTQGDGGSRKTLAAVPFLHGLRDAVVRDQVGTMLQEEPLKDGRSRGDNGRARKAAMK
jgi:hypothetical protein